MLRVINKSKTFQTPGWAVFCLRTLPCTNIAT